MVITKDSEPVRPRSHILELAPTTISILSESSRISMTEQDSITRVESKKLSTNISSGDHLNCCNLLIAHILVRTCRELKNLFSTNNLTVLMKLLVK